MELIRHVNITRESTRLAVLLPLTRFEVLTHPALYIGACAALACIQLSSSLVQHCIVAICSVRKYISF